MKIAPVLFALAFSLSACGLVGKSDSGSNDARRFLLGDVQDQTDYVEKGYTRILWVDFNDCSVQNHCLIEGGKSSGVVTEYAVVGNGAGLFVEDSVYSNRMKDSTFHKLWKKDRVPRSIKTLSELQGGSYRELFDEKPKCLNIDQPTKDTLTVNGTQVIADRIHTPCMPYKLESEMTKVNP